MPLPAVAKGSCTRFDEARARAAEQRLLEAIRERPGLGPGPLARALAAPLSSTKQRLERLADAGTIERGSDGGWRVAGEEARPMAASPN
jgi:DNA-binding IclR family transcriptional regulator